MHLNQATYLAYVLVVCACATRAPSAETDAGTLVPETDAGPRVVVDSGRTVGQDGGRDTDSGPVVAAGCEMDSPRSGAVEGFVGPTGLKTRLGDFIDDAEGRLGVMIYEFYSDTLVNKLIAAKDRGVDVRVILDGNRSSNSRARNALMRGGVDVQNAPESFSYYHVKALVTDESALITGANFNDYSFESERNYGLTLHDPNDIADIWAIFEQDWDGTSLAAAMECTRLAVSPLQSRDSIENFLQEARAEVRLQQMSFSDDNLRELVRFLEGAEIEVRIILANPEWVEGNAEAATFLRGLGAEVRFLRTYENHAKLILLDDDRAFVGSENFSWNSLERNREIGVATTDSDAVALFARTFENDWDDATFN